MLKFTFICFSLRKENLPKESKAAISTGNWGCGAFGGDPHLKFIIQSMAASVAERDLMYFTFHDIELATEFRSLKTFDTSVNFHFQTSLQLSDIYRAISSKSVAELYSLLEEYEPESCTVYDYFTAQNSSEQMSQDFPSRRTPNPEKSSSM